MRNHILLLLSRSHYKQRKFSVLGQQKASRSLETIVMHLPQQQQNVLSFALGGRGSLQCLHMHFDTEKLRHCEANQATYVAFEAGIKPKPISKLLGGSYFASFKLLKPLDGPQRLSGGNSKFTVEKKPWYGFSQSEPSSENSAAQLFGGECKIWLIQRVIWRPHRLSINIRAARRPLLCFLLFSSCRQYFIGSFL